MNKITLSSIAVAIGLSFTAGAMAQTTQPRATNKEQPSVNTPMRQQPMASGDRKTSRMIHSEYNAALKSCKSMARDARSNCRRDAKAQRTADREQMRTARTGATGTGAMGSAPHSAPMRSGTMDTKSDKIQQGK